MNTNEKDIIGVAWQYCKNLNEINRAIIDRNPNWEGLTSAEQIVSITFDTNHMCYVVFWRMKLEPEMTYGDIFDRFVKQNPDLKVKDYRPCCELYDVPNMHSAIVVWLEDDSKIIYQISD